MPQVENDVLGDAKDTQKRAWASLGAVLACLKLERAAVLRGCGAFPLAFPRRPVGYGGAKRGRGGGKLRKNVENWHCTKSCKSF